VYIVHQRAVPLADLFDISESDTLWDAWLNTVTLLDILENIQHISQYYNFQEARNKIAKIYVVAESHAIDKKNMKCLCGLSDGEHALLKRKMIKFFKLQVANLKHFVY
jgi:hypothetical protein